MKCILPSGVNTEDLRKYHKNCDICGAQMSMTSALSSGEIWRDSNGEIYLSFIEHSAATGLIHAGKEGFLIASKNIAWPIHRLPAGTVLTITQKPEGSGINA